MKCLGNFRNNNHLSVKFYLSATGFHQLTLILGFQQYVHTALEFGFSSLLEVHWPLKVIRGLSGLGGVLSQMLDLSRKDAGKCASGLMVTNELRITGKATLKVTHRSVKVLLCLLHGNL